MGNWLGDTPEGDRWEIRLYGVIAPLSIVGLALLWIVSRHADLHDRNKTGLRGMDAVASGLTALCLALALHFHFYWRLSESPRLSQSCLVGTTFSLAGAVIGLLYMTWCFVRLFIL